MESHISIMEILKFKGPKSDPLGNPDFKIRS